MCWYTINQCGVTKNASKKSSLLSSPSSPHPHHLFSVTFFHLFPPSHPLLYSFSLILLNPSNFDYLHLTFLPPLPPFPYIYSICLPILNSFTSSPGMMTQTSVNESRPLSSKYLRSSSRGPLAADANSRAEEKQSTYSVQIRAGYRSEYIHTCKAQHEAADLCNSLCVKMFIA